MSLFDFFFAIVFYVYACMYEYVSCACLVPLGTKKVYQIPLDWSYRWLWHTMWVLGMSSIEEASAFNQWATSPTTPRSTKFHLCLFSYWIAKLQQQYRTAFPQYHNEVCVTQSILFNVIILLWILLKIYLLTFIFICMSVWLYTCAG